MDHPSSSSLPSAKSRGYRHRSRPASTIERTAVAVATNVSTTARVDGKQHSSFRRRPKPSTPKESIHDASIVIPFPVPPILTTNWLLRTAPVVLARYLIYARGMWPMSVPQLLLLQQQEKNQQEENGINDLSNHNHNRIGNDRNIAANRKRRRLNNENRINPSLRRKQQRAMDQITRLCDEWTRCVAASPSLVGHHSMNNENERIESRNTPLSSMPSFSAFPGSGCQQQQNQHQQHEQTKIPRFLLILLGPSHGQGRELYLLDFQSLIDEDDCHSSPNHADTTKLTQEQEQQFEAMLARKLISALMNHNMGDDERPSVANSLPAQTSPSFRLWFTAGFENHHTSGSSTDTDEPMTGESTSKAGCVPNQSATKTATASPFSTVSWIPRTKFPLRKQKSQPRPSRNQSLVTIRFSRSQKQHQPLQQKHACQNENNTNKDEARGNNNHITTASNLLRPTSEQLAWMSLSTCVKGFRL